MYGLKKEFFFIIFYLCISIGAIAQNEEFVYNDTEKRDPFIPLIDESGNLRKNFTKPSQDSMLPKVSLMGISKVGDVFYAIIDGELVKEGQVYKDIKIQKIDADKVTVSYLDREFELEWETEKK
jgi:hypothetical protein